ncbi:3-ketoacyl-CoA thiolase 2 peroxisomal [Zea mays]|uniref:3-ketoacyl-CoA thiolase 2 peroxisomal n=1 Tax=Zea mays TaxID=4577 RepID=A0A1D6E8I1_MAIZE|nr:3-ketoacyl-CoA thiolase 2 peroxisomal [Zea mays]
MEKAIDRQRVLLAHLLPSPSATSSQPQLAASACAAGDSAAYQRSSSFGDDVITARTITVSIEEIIRTACVSLQCLQDPNMQGQARRLQGHLPRGPPHCCSQGSLPFKVNRQCSSRLQAVADVVAAIKVDKHILESTGLSSAPMGITSENVAHRYGVTRQEQDQATVSSSLSIDCNSSQVSDGAGAVLLMKRSVALKKGLPILGVFRLPNLPYLD